MGSLYGINAQEFYESRFYSIWSFRGAVELLLPDELLREYPNCSIYQIAASVGVPEEFVGLKG
ncbi:hypothetical protein HMPREF9166_1291 [Selenomonas sp. oral taxon 149 str. 67H29BP]|nr:hypothetical protein HMPREF9166_1291 [Selenomonas sp. oral taxon 149 str. 67H29BP]